MPDPYSYLENKASAAAQSFITSQEARYQNYVVSSRDPAPSQYFQELLNQPEKGIPTRAGDHYLFYHKDPADKVAKLMISDTADGKGIVLVDPNQIDPGGQTTLADVSISPDGRYLTYSINNPQFYSDSKAPDWETRTRVKDLANGKDLPDVIERSGFTWWDKDAKGFLYNRMVSTGDGQQDYKMVMMHHRLGDDPAQDTIFGASQNLPYGAPTNSSYNGNFSYKGEQEWYFTGGGADHKHRAMMIKDATTGKYRTVLEEGIAECRPIAETNNGVLMWTDHGAPKGKIVLFDPDDPAPEKWKTIVPESSDALRHAFVHDSKIFALYVHNCAHQISIFDTSGAALGKVPLPPQTMVEFDHSKRPGVSLGRGINPQENNDLFFRISSFDRPATVYRYDSGGNILMPMDQMLDKNDPQLIVEQLWARSKDGTPVPMTAIRRADVVLDGTAALKISGYGAYGSVPGPHWDPAVSDFVNSGGIFVQTNIRGGGEFGQEWADQGRLLNKTNSFDDFNACAEYLVKNKYTSSSRMVSYGHSAGGLLVLAAMQRAPGLYGAVIASAPVANMLGQEQAAAGHYETGDPYSSRKIFEYNMSYSPLHNIRADIKYPDVLVRCGEHDWLLPGALKFAAEMQHTSPQSTTLLHIEKGFGHGVQRPTDVALKEYALEKVFIEKSIGPINQNLYNQLVSNKNNTGINGESLTDNRPVHGQAMNSQQFAATTVTTRRPKTPGV